MSMTNKDQEGIRFTIMCKIHDFLMNFKTRELKKKGFCGKFCNCVPQILVLVNGSLPNWVVSFPPIELLLL